jgi:hypothetical protein
VIAEHRHQDDVIAEHTGALEHITASPGRFGQICRAALVLSLFGKKMLT